MSELPQPLLFSEKSVAGFPVRHFPVVSSTQQIAKDLCAEGNVNFCISADQQSTGRGRLERSWSSPKGNVSLSIAIKSNNVFVGSLSFIASLAVYRVINRLVEKQNNSSRVMLKWPNDVMVDNAKISGILIEYITQPQPILIVGIGVNIIPVDIKTSYKVTSLKQQAIETNSTEITDSLIQEFSRICDHVRQNGSASVMQDWQNAAHPIGTTITARTLQDTFTGKFEAIAANGALLLKLENGSIARIMSADCFIGLPS